MASYFWGMGPSLKLPNMVKEKRGRIGKILKKE
jgi:hypothetical protein